ncbi:hypothetical protein [Tychonema sp. LEGE 06208]|uniref:hypothetical protein n=1 Tax=Tychonema sp. LEGE 06208 TaxID=1828663 RepID=UPI001883043E|nr:hypothetical protein [Tychonema sp. LEGE 06208]MBE9160842.1 hypothetical protein [Tychonema sp. LEGE 06208]
MDNTILDFGLKNWESPRGYCGEFRNRVSGDISRDSTQNLLETGFLAPAVNSETGFLAIFS